MKNKFEEIILTKFALHNRQLASFDLLGDPTRLDVYLNHNFNAVELSFKKYIATQEVAKREARYPTTWWDAFKERWFPAVLCKRWPVHYTYIKLEAKLLYPKLLLPNHETRMIITESRNTYPLEFDDEE